MNTKPIPAGYEGLIPTKVVKDAAKAIEFYKQLFGATEKVRMNVPGSDKVAHAELNIRGSILMLGDECPEMGFFAPKGETAQPSSVFIYVEDVDATMEKALKLGSKIAMPVMDMFWGDRYGKFVDPFGHLWGIATHTKDVTPEDCAKGMEEWSKKKPGQ
jgi:uncharacterized glyoxalase superfamily protein PhnB